MTRLTFSLPKSLKNKLAAAAAADKRKPAQLLRVILEERLAKAPAAARKPSRKAS